MSLIEVTSGGKTRVIFQEPGSLTTLTGKAWEPDKATTKAELIARREAWMLEKERAVLAKAENQESAPPATDRSESDNSQVVRRRDLHAGEEEGDEPCTSA